MANPTISQIKVGNTTYDIKDAAASGGLELNDVITSNMSANIGAANPIPDETWTQTIRVGSSYDKALADSGSAAYINHRRHRNNDRDINSTYAAYGITRHSDLDDSNTLNSLYLWVDDDKQRKVTVSEAKPWRIGLGANANGRWGTNLITMDSYAGATPGTDSDVIPNNAVTKCTKTVSSLPAGEYVAFCFLRILSASSYVSTLTNAKEAALAAKTNVSNTLSPTLIAQCFEKYQTYYEKLIQGFRIVGHFAWTTDTVTNASNGTYMARSHASAIGVHYPNHDNTMLTWGTRFSLSSASEGSIWVYQNSGGSIEVQPAWYAWRIGTNG